VPDIRCNRTHKTGKAVKDIVMIVSSESELLQLIGALHPPCGFPCGLHCRKQEGNQYADDGDDDKKFDESEAYPTGLFSLSYTYVRSILQHFAAVKQL
jgi:hypothetical protein